MTTTFPRFLAAWMLALLAMMGAVASGADVSVKASVNRGVTVAGDPVQYQIRVVNAKKEADAPEVSAQGLEIRYLGPSSSNVVRISGGGFFRETTTTYVYQVTAEKDGTYTIPAVDVIVDGQKYRTEPVALAVQKSAVADAERPQVQGFAEVILSKKTAYVGEVIPVELKLYIDSRVRWQTAAMPEISGEGFTKQKMPEPARPKQETRDGREYDVMIFKTAITPGKAGRISIGPAEILYNAQVPRARRSGPRSLFDIFDDDVFGDSFFSQTQQVKVKAPAVELTVKPLPAAGKPRDFSGAVGSFQFSAFGSPRLVKMGDPVTMKLTVTGRGNFDRMDAPMLKDPTGWRAYPPSSNFAKDDGDAIGIRGTKTFEMAVIPEEAKSQMPVFSFSYFDPEAEKYVTLLSEPATLSVEGGKPSSQPRVAAEPAPETGAEAGAIAPKTGPSPADILGLRYDAGAGAGSFEPLYAMREFKLAQIAPLVVLLGLLAFRLRRRPDARAVRESALRRERAVLLGKLHRRDLEHSEFLDHAARVVQIDTALATGCDPAGVDAGTARAAGRVDAAEAEVIDDIFEARAELLFAGSGRNDGRVAEAERNRVLGMLENFGRSL
jgi:hypothetical protein